MLKYRPRAWRWLNQFGYFVDVEGHFGIRITSAPPATPLYMAIHPESRPITSTTITRLCASAVVWTRSMASWPR